MSSRRSRSGGTAIDAALTRVAPRRPHAELLQVDGGVGAHSGTFQVLSFDGQSLRQEVGGASSSPGAGYLADLNGDGQQDVVLNATERYIFCYACGVSAPYFQVYTWDGRQMRQVAIAPMGVAEQSQSYWLPNNEAVRLAEAGLWAEAFRTSGCPGCNRPYYNERPGQIPYNYPRPPTPAELADAVAMALDGVKITEPASVERRSTR